MLDLNPRGDLQPPESGVVNIQECKGTKSEVEVEQDRRAKRGLVGLPARNCGSMGPLTSSCIYIYPPNIKPSENTSDNLRSCPDTPPIDLTGLPIVQTVRI